MKNLSKDKALVNDWIKNGLYWTDDQGNKQYEQNATDRFCSGDYLNKLAQLVRLALIKMPFYSAGGPLEEIMEDNIKPMEENFDKILLGNFGLTVVFPPYAVSSGAQGTVRVFLPYSSVSDIVCLP